MSIPTPPALGRLLKAMEAGGAAGLAIPPPVFTEMGAEAVDYAPGDAETHLGARLRCRFPVDARFGNPMGHMQGGMIAAAIDNVIGPLSYLVAPPSATTQLTTTFLAPVTPSLEHIEVEARFTHRSGRQLVFDAEVFGPDGAVLSVARATCQIVRR